MRGVLPGEFEGCDALLLAWMANYSDGERRVMMDIIAHSWKRATILLLVLDDQQQQLAAAALTQAEIPLSAVRFVPFPVYSPWTRDYGPFVTKSFHGGPEMVDAIYGRSPIPPGTKDEHVPQAVAEMLGLKTVSAPLVLDGGNLLSNGAGVCLTTLRLLEANSDRPEAEIRALLREFFGAEQTVLLEPLLGEPCGHVDMFCTFTGPDTVVIGEYDVLVDPENAAILERNATRLGSVKTACGPLRVVRIPMPPRHDNRWLTYTNVVFANGKLLVPTYTNVEPEFNEQALATFRQLLPRWEVVGVNATPLAQRDGALHCATLNLHRIRPGW
jgi:agmatine/peptidylarginine deiminase